MKSKVALIIGAGTSLGSSITKVFADDNFTVVPVRREGEKLKPLEEEINSKGGKCFSFSLDARKEDEVKNFIERVEPEEDINDDSSHPIEGKSDLQHKTDRLVLDNLINWDFVADRLR